MLKHPVKWVGFDMDECVGTTHYLYPFARTFLTRNPSGFFNAALKALAKSEMKRHTGYLRPALFPVLDKLYTAWKSGKITGAFMFSNNSNQALVELIRQLLNTIMGLQHSLPHPPLVVQMAVSAQTPERTSSFIKDWDGVVACLKSKGLAPPVRKQDLLFYDDMPHVLERQIQHYCRVPKYTYVTPQALLINLIGPLVPPDLDAQWKTCRQELMSVDHSAGGVIPTTDRGLLLMTAALQQFVSGASQTRSRRAHRRLTRKNRRHL